MDKITADKISEWLDIINYWYDEVKEIGERYDVMWPMYEKYDKMIDEMYNLQKQIKQQN